MNLSDLILYIVFPLIAIPYVICYSAIFEPMRKRLKKGSGMANLVACPACTAFWVGLLVVGPAIKLAEIAWMGPRWLSTGFEFLQMSVLAALAGIAIWYIFMQFFMQEEDNGNETTKT